ncbi:M1 family metallopeptidase [Halomonas heilongjiangensis]|uniref:Peptidase M1 n=1 Tax=Halomonas heilongjiangensis TaxID=1387883 RepID=A0A2N7TK19_9GAMM|nr:M1 family aminopeptidase [Halomonas heilongjiangensis]PMR68532.1 peptidase M1 [Halomonas heilongjiangensis]PXX86691.1 peptidase M1 [Halomonas heilongjiangensis]
MTPTPRPRAGCIALALLLAWGGATAGEPARTLALWLDPASRELRGEMRLTLRSGDEFHLLDGLEVTRVERGGRPVAPVRLAPGHYRLPPSPEEASPPEAGAVTVHWRGTLPARLADTPLRVSPAGSLLPTRGGWYPRVDDPPPRPLALTIHLPDGQRAVGTGSLVEEHASGDGMTSRYTHPRTRDIEVAVGPWQPREREADGIRLRTLFPAALDERFADTYLAHTARYLAMFQQRLGPYPFDSFTLAAFPEPVGLAFPGFTLLGERVIPLPFIPHTSLAHELMHAWWGAGVGVDHASGNWSEALTTYLADYALDEARGEARETRRRWLADLAALPAAEERPLASFRGGPDPVGRLIGYQHGAMVFHMLRRRIGDDAFTAGLRRLADDRMFRTAAWQDLQAAFEAAADDDLTDFFGAWLTRPGRPELALDDVTLEASGAGFRVGGELTQRGAHAPWPLEVPVTLETAGEPIQTTLRLHGHAATFSLDSDRPPTALAVDPDHHLLRRLSEPPAILRALILDPTTRLLALDDALAPLGRRVLGREAEAFTGDRHGDAPLLVIGTTAAVADWLVERELPAPPRSLARAGHARLWTLPGTRIGLLSADDAPGLERLSRALRHHGHRSYLVQDAEGNTLDAGHWEADTTALRVELTP